jgi:hypothetical protein
MQEADGWELVRALLLSLIQELKRHRLEQCTPGGRQINRQPPVVLRSGNHDGTALLLRGWEQGTEATQDPPSAVVPRSLWPRSPSL